MHEWGAIVSRCSHPSGGPGMTLNLSNIQGNIVPGFNKDHQAFLLLAFMNQQSAQAWLRATLPEIAAAREVYAFKEAFAVIRERRKQAFAYASTGDTEDRRDHGALRTISATWVNIAFTSAGLQLLIGDEVGEFPSPFLANRTQPVLQAPSATTVHALLQLAADWRGDLEWELDKQRQRLERFGARIVNTFRGDTLPGELRGREHFGYADGLSQPELSETYDPSGQRIAIGEFVLGYPDQSGGTSGGLLPVWARDGSFLTFVQLEQDVRAFRELQIQPRLKAQLVGRYADGQLAERVATPYSHIGRANPRDPRHPEGLDSLQVSRHRLLRRGIPYGPPYAQATADEQRGLFFLAYQADIARQFEHVWSRWLENPDFPSPSSGNDPIVGKTTRGARARRISLPLEHERGGRIELSLRQFVFPRYACYLFAPSLDALHQLAGVTMSWEDSLTLIARELGKRIDEAAASSPESLSNGIKGRVPVNTTTAYNGTTGTTAPSQGVNQMAPIGTQLTASVLGQIINTENPYTQASLTLRDLIEMVGPAAAAPGVPYTMTDVTLRGPETDPREYWMFNGEKNAITKAIRIKYTYVDGGGVQHNAELLIGYNGPPVP
jgi:Dyp-type peroxidase family